MGISTSWAAANKMGEKRGGWMFVRGHEGYLGAVLEVQGCERSWKEAGCRFRGGKEGREKEEGRES